MPGDAYGEGQQGDLHELVEAARGMANGKFREIVAVQAKGEIGRLVHYINQTMQNLQQLDPAVGGSSRSLPQMSGQLSEVVKTTEQASMRVLNEIDQMVEEQMAVEEGLRRLSTLLEAKQAHDPQLGETIQILEDLRVRHSCTKGRALEIMSAMEFQDITAQCIQKSMILITEVENRLLRLLVMFNIPAKGGDNSEDDSRWKALEEFAVASKSGEMDQEMVDRILAEFGQKAR